MNQFDKWCKLDGMEHGTKKNPGKENLAKRENLFTTEEKAQYEVFANGALPRETLENWIKNDLRAVSSLAHTCLHDEEIFKALCDVYYDRYLKIHPKAEDHDEPK